jgi:hypothetical protein
MGEMGKRDGERKGGTNGREDVKKDSEGNVSPLKSDAHFG